MKILPIITVIISATVVTTLGIGAADSLQGKSGSLLGQLFGSLEQSCPKGMVAFTTALTFSCVDTYEVSPSKVCSNESPQSALDTSANLAQLNCIGVSTESQLPWRFITREEASVVCARAKKRLPTAAEWYQFSLGTPSNECNIDTATLHPGGQSNGCTSPSGVVDTVGNVWEWTSDDVIDGTYNGRTLPASGYVSQVDAGGVATETNELTPESQFGSDYIWSNKQGAFGIIRGGFYGSKDDGGVFTFQAETKPTFAGAAVGFRCVQ